VKTTLLKKSRRISDRHKGGVVEREGHNMPLRPLSNSSINKCMALLSRILDDAVEAATCATTLAAGAPPSSPSSPAAVARTPRGAGDIRSRRTLGLTRQRRHRQGAVSRRASQSGLPYKEIGARLSISISTAHYRQSR
jgi:hypothetical protein